MEITMKELQSKELSDIAKDIGFMIVHDEIYRPHTSVDVDTIDKISGKAVVRAVDRSPDNQNYIDGINFYVISKNGEKIGYQKLISHVVKSIGDDVRFPNAFGGEKGVLDGNDFNFEGKLHDIDHDRRPRWDMLEEIVLEAKLPTEYIDVRTLKGVLTETPVDNDGNTIDYFDIISEMPSVENYVKGVRGRLMHCVANFDENISVVVMNVHSHAGSSGVGMSSRVFLSRDGVEKFETYQYRDHFDAKKDDCSNNFGSARIANVTNDGFDVIYNPGTDNSKKIHYDLGKSEVSGDMGIVLTDAEQGEFETQFQKQSEELRARSQRDGITPGYVVGLDRNLELPYRAPFVKDRFVNLNKGDGVVVIEAQIDHSSGRGKQTGWVAYKISAGSEPEEIQRDNVWDVSLGQGAKIPDVVAFDIYKKMSSDD